MVGKIILLSDVYEVRRRKEEELAFYRAELEKLQERIFFLQKQVDVTNMCIAIIEEEMVVQIGTPYPGDLR